jgi:hypothetical protein
MIPIQLLKEEEEEVGDKGLMLPELNSGGSSIQHLSYSFAGLMTPHDMHHTPDA